MKKLIDFAPIIFLSLVILHLLLITLLRFLFKIKSNIKLEKSIRKNKSKVKNIIYIGLFIFAFILSIMLDTNFNFILILMCLDNLILSIIVLKKLGNSNEKYHYITSIVFHPLQIISLILMAFNSY